MDHGYETDEHKRCVANTQKQRQCTLPPLRGIDRCALHSGLAIAKNKAGHGDPKALAAYRRSSDKALQTAQRRSR